ncbi:MAG TPA: serine/threonine-protein kinase [Ktedonobacteraceae bacterium]
MPLEGHLLGHYQLQHLIGSGGMGEIYVADDIHMPRKVAVKIIRGERDPYADTTIKQEAERLFQREMQAIALLDHPHILPVFDYGTDQVDGADLTYLVMPYRSEGSLLDQLVKRGSNTPLSPHEVVHFLLQAADALQHAHERHIVHQDIKPSNFLIRIRNSEAYLPDILLADFGIAKVINANSSSQSVRGTPSYMSPEQWEGQPVPASDQYSLAVMAFQLLTGQAPFRGGPGQIMHQHFSAQPPIPSTLNPHLSPAIDAVLLRALAKRPEERFPSIFQFAQAFQRALSQESMSQPGLISQNPSFQADARPLAAIRGPLLQSMASSPQDATFSDENSYSHQQASSASLPTQQQIPFSPLPLPAREYTMAGNLQAIPADNKVQPPSRLSLVQKILLSAVIVLVILTGSGVFLVYRTSSSGSAVQTSTSKDTSSLTSPQVTATAQVETTATAQVKATATAQAISNDPYLSGKGKLLMSDTLSAPKTTWKDAYATTWGGTCIFEEKAYHIMQHIGPDRSYHCDAGTALQAGNFAYEVQMTVIQGTCGGIAFRYNSTTQKGYSFQVCADGSVLLQDVIGSKIKIPFESISSAVHRGLNQHNIVAVAANGHTIMFYVNKKRVGSVTGTTMSKNQFAFFALDNNEPTEVAFRDVKIWKL